MKQILIYSGTTEGRRLAEVLCRNGIRCTACVATEYGEMVMERLEGLEGLTVRQGRMTAMEMKDFLTQGDYLAVVDATHPFATVVSENIRDSMAGSGIPYLRLKRDTKSMFSHEKNISCYPTSQACAEALKETAGNILLTTGSKELAVYSRIAELKGRLYVRVLPGLESISLCYENGITGKQIIAMQGPFSVEMNEAILKQFDISCLVTKESGSTGGFFEKIQAAGKNRTKVMVIGNPEGAGGLTDNEVYTELEKLTGKALLEEEKMQISFIGMGMGSLKLLTREAEEKLKEADFIIGARRLLEGIPWQKEKIPYYLAQDIIPYLKESKGKRAAILFSGDTGFYSGAEKLYEALKNETEEGGLRAEVSIYPGISSVAYLAARLHTSWQEAEIVSIHGRAANVLEAVRENKKTFLLVSGVADMRAIGNMLLTAGMEEVGISAGYQLSYPEEKILTLTPGECLTLEEEGLYVCLLENERAERRRLTHGLPDEAFLRGKVPMTKEEVREVSVCKLGLTKEAVLYDVGSGTGSIAVECARLSDGIQVFAIEKKKEAAELIEENRSQYGLSNLTLVRGEAPEALNGLPAPTHVFIGGSSGNMKEILAVLYQKNPKARIVVNAITLETVGEVTGLLKTMPVEKEEVIQIQVSRAKAAGGYHLMQAENPVYILSFFFTKDGKDE
ncbi:precorrin-6Y C5,15-methyltransferase (decarboxylating) [Anaerocolumna jejuensis DSM 15929]|uniref:Precorrin-6Y C5,15-methyltransferase (Decarboxylating) n=1 Tax=Anaerocolumna jejuensis DSM 15929 TaxID=1121322 RepID=A0A1M6SLS3_9FIRM|nr:bifunctional cobalt-precorrin-7 (C(5))-methyltransferase/cobalt-precorrin-6B (C(15))-methyltransferase [Anaerocolumna jejuensis]SHK45682.1 precorrin-6Y C5,15-methyltransferase (decarboxylating) [Anaerocolumna jejuensis DSM 15929]